MSIVDEIFEKREVRELISEIRDDLTAQSLFRTEYLSKLDEIAFYLKKISEQYKRDEEKI